MDCVLLYCILSLYMYYIHLKHDGTEKKGDSHIPVVVDSTACVYLSSE